MSQVPSEVIELAQEICKKSNMKQRMSAVVFDGAEILGQGCNRLICEGSVPPVRKYGKGWYSVHAELQAIRWAVKKHGYGRLLGCSIYVMRENGRIAKPCQHCMQIIEMVGIKNIFWSER